MFLTSFSPKSSKAMPLRCTEVIVDALGNADLPALDQTFDPGNDVYAVAENVVVLDHDVAGH
jgi:hypothetical protein